MLDTKNKIIDYALNIIKIDAIGFTKPEIPAFDLENYKQYLKEKNYGDMLWMETRFELRANPKMLLPSAQSAIVLGFNYFDETKIKKDYEISLYANQKIDYHKWVYSKIKLLSIFLNQEFKDENRFFVDSAPILEKVLAKQTHIGWQGKHTCVVSREFGSWLFLGVLLTNLLIEEDVPHQDFCGSCTKCIDACPTGAITPYKLDVSKCLSYLTIEHKDVIPELFHSALGDKLFGCDDCLRACHFNKWQKQSTFEEIYENQKYPQNLIAVLQMSELDFENIFKNTPIKRTGYKHILSNAIIIAKNSSNKIFVPYIKHFIDYPDIKIQKLANDTIKFLSQL